MIINSFKFQSLSFLSFKLSIMDKKTLNVLAINQEDSLVLSFSIISNFSINSFFSLSKTIFNFSKSI
jgi:hypothetical protein